MNAKCQWHQRPWQTRCPCRADETEIHQNYTPKLCCSTHQSQGLCSSPMLVSWNTAVHKKCDYKVKGGEGRGCKSLSCLSRGGTGRLTHCESMTSSTDSWVTWCVISLLKLLFISSLQANHTAVRVPSTSDCMKWPFYFHLLHLFYDVKVYDIRAHLIYLFRHT